MEEVYIKLEQIVVLAFVPGEYRQNLGMLLATDPVHRMLRARGSAKAEAKVPGAQRTLEEMSWQEEEGRWQATFCRRNSL